MHIELPSILNVTTCSSLAVLVWATVFKTAEKWVTGICRAPSVREEDYAVTSKPCGEFELAFPMSGYSHLYRNHTLVEPIDCMEVK